MYHLPYRVELSTFTELNKPKLTVLLVDSQSVVLWSVWFDKFGLDMNKRKFLLLWLLTWVLLCVTQYSSDTQVAVAPEVDAARVRAQV